MACPGTPLLNFTLTSIPTDEEEDKMAENDGGLIGAIATIIRRNRLERNLRRREEEIERDNAFHRGVTEYLDAPVEAFVPRDGLGDVVCSGNNAEIRDRVACAMAYNAHRKYNRPVVVLHCKNHNLQNQLGACFPQEHCYIVNSDNPIYDPFVGLTRVEIARLVLNSQGERNAVRGPEYINALIEYLSACGTDILVNSCNECLLEGFNSMLVSSCEIDGLIKNRINLLINMGIGDAGAVAQYFDNLSTEAMRILAREQNALRAISIKQAIEQNSLISIDLGVMSNRLLIGVICQELRSAIAQGKEFMLVLDGIPVISSETLKELLDTYSSNCNFVYTSNDLWADLQCAEATFNTVLAKAECVFAMRHNSGDTNERFSKNFGNYKKIEINRTITRGDTYGSYDQLLPGMSVNEILNPQPVDRPRVEVQEMQELAYDELFIRQIGTREIARVRITPGNARMEVSEPQPK